MGLLKKKKKSTGFGTVGGGVSSREQSPLRPKHVEKMPPCIKTCPSGNQIRKFITTIAQAERVQKPQEKALEEAWHVYTDTSPFPAICGRICPHPCEGECNRKELEGAVSINKIERTVGDYAIEKGLALKKLTEDKQSEKIAVVGSGPGGLTCAYQLARRGYSVTVYEAEEKPGGMLLWGIPRYRLPADILEAEIQKILDLGVELKCNTRVGKDISLDDLTSQYQAVYVGIGAMKGLKLRVEGEDAENVLSGVDFLSRIHHGEKVDVGDNVIVVGGGDTAIDAARICKRLGATTTILYRRTIKEMPAIDEEIEEAQNEDIKLEYLAAPIGFIKDGNRITKVKAIRMELGEPDSSGRRRPVPQEGSEFEIPATAVIAAISQEPDFNGFDTLIEGRDWIKINNQGETKVDNVYAGGDATNLDIATTAIGHGRKAAEAIDRKLRGTTLAAKEEMPIVKADRMRLDHYEKAERVASEALSKDERFADMNAEVNKGLAAEAVVLEAKRCMSCGYCFDCEKCWMFCQDSAINKPLAKLQLYSFKMENCTGCKKCGEECPCGFIDML
jgi:NADPH-dependent glutamate synthase beta subunit-like oxidoreductase